MSAITWDPEIGRTYYNGIDQVALYIKETNGTHSYGAPTAWDGVTALNEAPTGAESTKLYADNKEYLNLLSKEDFGATLEAYQSPEQFDQCDGMTTITDDGTYAGNIHGQSRKAFGLSYRVLIGDGDNAPDPDKKTLNCEYHLVYGCRAGVASVDHPTINETPDATTFSWELSTIPQSIGSALTAAGFVPTAHVIIKAREITGATDAAKLAKLDKITDVLHGTTNTSGYLPTPDELLTLSLT